MQKGTQSGQLSAFGILTGPLPTHEVQPGDPMATVPS